MSQERTDLITKLIGHGFELNKIKRLSMGLLKSKLKLSEPAKALAPVPSTETVVTDPDAPIPTPEVDDEVSKLDAVKAYEENEAKVAEDSLLADVQAALLLAVEKRHVLKATFLTSIKLGLKIGRHNMHYIHTSYMRQVPRPHAHNMNADLVEIYERYKKHVN